MLNQELGRIIETENSKWIVTEKGRNGCAVFGPYEVFDPGQYVVKFEIEISKYVPFYMDSLAAIVEVTSNFGNTVIAKSNVYAGKLLNGNTSIDLGFALSEQTELEFRVHTMGRAELKIDHDRTVKQIPSGQIDYSPLLPPGVCPTNQFFLDNIGHFRHLHERGASVKCDDSGNIVCFNGISFYVKNREDFFIADEVFSCNTYNVKSDKKCIVIDVGMNVGFTSLYMANMENVVGVYSFEPFSTPYERALRNFELNPSLSPKIRAFNYGLGSTNDRLTVFSHEDLTIGTSIKGLSSGTPEQIVIRDAGEVLGEIIEDARRRDLEIIAKVDCEGSEFAIFESLDARQLVKKIRVFLIEWHKWWAFERTQEEIVSCLIRNDFLVFDRTMQDDMIAGQIFATRAS